MSISYVCSAFQPYLGPVHLFVVENSCVAIFFGSSFPFDDGQSDVLLAIDAQCHVARSLAEIRVTPPNLPWMRQGGQLEVSLAAVYGCFDVLSKVLPVLYNTCTEEFIRLHVDNVQRAQVGEKFFCATCSVFNELPCRVTPMPPHPKPGSQLLPPTSLGERRHQRRLAEYKLANDLASSCSSSGHAVDKLMNEWELFS